MIVKIFVFYALPYVAVVASLHSPVHLTELFIDPSHLAGYWMM